MFDTHTQMTSWKIETMQNEAIPTNDKLANEFTFVKVKYGL